jgi:hypothetical protein
MVLSNTNTRAFVGSKEVDEIPEGERLVQDEKRQNRLSEAIFELLFLSRLVQCRVSENRGDRLREPISRRLKEIGKGAERKRQNRLG